MRLSDLWMMRLGNKKAKTGKVYTYVFFEKKFQSHENISYEMKPLNKFNYSS